MHAIESFEKKEGKNRKIARKIQSHSKPTEMLAFLRTEH